MKERLLSQEPAAFDVQLVAHNIALPVLDVLIEPRYAVWRSSDSVLWECQT